jgi:hypothetical protein
LHDRKETPFIRGLLSLLASYPEAYTHFDQSPAIGKKSYERGRWHSAPQDVLRNQPHGRIAFANTISPGASDHRNSIREADRAVKQLIGA